MRPVKVFEIVLAEFERAVVAAHRYESLKYGRISHDQFSPADIARQIFKEFYSRQGGIEHSGLVPGWRRLLHLHLTNSLSAMPDVYDSSSILPGRSRIHGDDVSD